jgi:hypothetical protein
LSFRAYGLATPGSASTPARRAGGSRAAGMGLARPGELAERSAI